MHLLQSQTFSRFWRHCSTRAQYASAASEVVLEILPNPEIGAFRKEDGEVVHSGEPRLG